MKKKRFILILGILVAIIISVSTGLFGQGEGLLASEAEKSSFVEKLK